MRNRVSRILVGFIIVLPILALLHEMLVIFIATLVDALANSDFLFQFVKQFLASPVHAKIMVETLGGVQAQGIVVAGLPGKFLNTIAPTLFLDPDTHPVSALVSAIVDKNSTVLGFYITQSIVEFIIIFIGAHVLQRALKKRTLYAVFRTGSLFDVSCMFIGFFLLAQAIWEAFSLTMSPTLAGLRETGIGVGFSLFLQLDKQRYNWLMDQALPLMIPTILITTAIGSAWLTGKFIQRVQVALGKPTLATQPSIISRLIRKSILAIALLPLLAISPVSQHYFGIANTALVASPMAIAQVQMPQPQLTEPAVVIPPTPTLMPTSTPLPTMVFAPTSQPVVVISPTAQPTLVPSPTPMPSPTPIRERQVELRKNGTRFTLVVNNQSTYMHGLNYNVNYTAQPDNIKRQYHQRDFQLMRNVGVNVVIGWGVYDQVTLEIARNYNIGVIMPFELDAKGAYENKNYRENIKNEFRKYILQYKDSLAVWGWNPGGDELLHRMETEQHRTPDKLQSASDFLLELSALAYTLDPNHPSIIKEPRDWYVPYVEESLRRVRAQKPVIDPSKYFIFATNTYGKPDGVSLVLNTTRQCVEDRLGIAFAIGEFAPFGLARSERATHYAIMWNTVRETSSLGGFAYVFGPDQPNPKAPNPYDPLRLLVSEFSLVDNEANPVDGSLNALSTQWQEIAPNEQAHNDPLR